MELPPVLTPQYDSENQKAFPNLKLTPVLAGFEQVTDIQSIPGADDQVLVLEKAGRLKRASLITRKSQLIMHFKVRSNSELGLLGAAFHPRFPEVKKLYLHTNPADGALRTRISEWTWIQAKATDSPVLSQERVLLEMNQPFSNHNGGQITFGPDGFLYIGLGDGGAAGDPQGHGQNLQSLLGKILRIDVQKATPPLEYGIPPDNPFVKKAGVRPEIWAYGLRNPWKFCFSPRGQLVVADVGQNQWEEISIVEKGSNYGWNTMEGKHCYSPSKSCQQAGLSLPIWEYGRQQGASITGGYVYQSKIPASMTGMYVYGDFVSGRMWALTLPPNDEFANMSLGRWPIAISTFGRLPDGRLLVADFNDGVIYRIDF